MLYVTDIVTQALPFRLLKYYSLLDTKGLPYDWCKSSDIRLIRPDVVIYLQAPLGVLIQRGDYGLERYEKVEFQTKVKEQFDKMIMEYGFHVVQADQD